MKRIQSLFLVLSLLPLLGTNAFAKDVGRDKLLELAKVTGMYEQVEQQKVAIKEQGGQAASQYAQQLLAAAPQLPPEFKADFENEFNLYMKKISNIIDTDFAVNAYVDLIGKELNINDVERIIAFYNSDVGKKYTQSNIAIMGQWTKIFMEDVDKKLMVHLQQFLENLKIAAAKYSNPQ